MPKSRPRYRLDPNTFDDDSFLAALNASDHLSAVLRAHLYIEAALTTLIETALPYPGEIESDDRRFGFEQKLDLAISLDLLDPNEKGAYGVLNQIRNKLAHHPEAFVSVGEVEKLITSLDAIQKAMVSSALKRQPLPGRDLAPILATLFLALYTRLAPAEAERPKPTDRRTRYAEGLREAKKQLQRYGSGPSG
jgi:hypothetical protein